MAEHTGIIRCLDDLGRTVIPKEIRRTLGLTEGDPLEIGVQDGCVVLTPYKSMRAFRQLCERMYNSIKENCLFDPMPMQCNELNYLSEHLDLKDAMLSHLDAIIHLLKEVEK